MYSYITDVKVSLKRAIVENKEEFQDLLTKVDNFTTIKDVLAESGWADVIAGNENDKSEEACCQNLKDSNVLLDDKGFLNYLYDHNIHLEEILLDSFARVDTLVKYYVLMFRLTDEMVENMIKKIVEK